MFLYVAGIPNLADLGSRFILQGGTQKNLAAVKSEVDFIRALPLRGQEPEIIVHEHCGESGAIGAGVEASASIRTASHHVHRPRGGQKIGYKTTRNEDTRCNFCKNNCLRTFIDIKVGDDVCLSRLPVMPVEKEVEKFRSSRRTPLDYRYLRKGHGGRRRRHARHQGRAGPDQGSEPELRRYRGARSVPPAKPESVADPIPSRAWTKAAKERIELMQARPKLRIGMPRVLNTYSYAPLFNAYFESLGLQPEKWSIRTTPRQRCIARARTAARSIPAFRRRSASRTSTT